MKKLFTLLSLAILGSQIFAQQIHNGNFENWTNGLPQNWTTSHSSFPNTTHETQDTNGCYPGSSSIKMVGGILPSPANMTYPGFTHYGGSNFDNTMHVFNLFGVSFHYRPDSFQFAYKYSPSFHDSASVSCTFYKSTGTVVGTFNTELYTSATYKLVTLPISYLNGNTPDSMSLTFYSGDLLLSHANSNLHVAAVKFIYINGTPIDTSSQSIDTSTHTVDTTHHTTSAINVVPAESEVKVFPNPASTKINFNVSDDLMGGIIRIYNILGSELITSEIGNNLESIDICPLQDGVYLYRILDRNDKLIKTGKFNKEK